MFPNFLPLNLLSYYQISPKWASPHILFCTLHVNRITGSIKSLEQVQAFTPNGQIAPASLMDRGGNYDKLVIIIISFELAFDVYF